MNQKTPGLKFAVGTLVFVGFAVIGAVLFRQPRPFNGAVFEPRLPAADFELDAGGGETFRLSEQRGEVVLLFFGYTNCPDFCPTTLATFKQVDAQLGGRGADVTYVMITADPERDTPQVMAGYVDLFSPEFVGLSGTREDLQAVWSAYGVFIESETPDEAGGYLVSHTASVYVIDRAGNLRMTFPYGTRVGDMAEDLQRLLNEKPTEGENS